VLEPLSEGRRKLLLAARLCTPADLRRARSHVKRLTRDLPAFDSVWLDALTALGRLTPFQARLIESSRPERIQIGPCVLVERLGGGAYGETFLARSRDGNEPCVAKILRMDDRFPVEVVDRLEDLINSLKDLAHPSLVVPHGCHRTGEQLAIVSRQAIGPALNDLLIRRGRFPGAVVLEIGRQLADGLRALEERREVHGDIRSANVRLTKAGIAVLVDTGIRRLIEPEVSIHTGLSAQRHDGTSPELIGTRAHPTGASDMYALGCLLWHLLAGRPPFPGGDPLVKLAAHQTRRIDDVRKWAPDTPSLLAEGIRRMTAHDPSDRPRNFAQLTERWGAPRRSGRRRLAAFRRWFDAPAPLGRNTPTPGRGSRWTRTLMLLGLAILLGIAWGDPRARGLLLSWNNRTSEVAPVEPEPVPAQPAVPRKAEIALTSAVAPAEPLRRTGDLPVPDRQGVVRLSPGGRYRAGELSVVGALVIEGDVSDPPRILVSDRGLRIVAESVTIRNVCLCEDREQASAPRRPAALLLVQARSLEIEHCVLDAAPMSETVPPESPTVPGALVAWKLIDPRNPRTGAAVFRETVMAGGDAAVYVADAAESITFTQCLRPGGGPLCHLASLPREGRTSTIMLDHVTCRGVDSVIRFAPADHGGATGGISVVAADSVLDPEPRGGLFGVYAAPNSSLTMPQVKLTGEGSIAPQEGAAAVLQDPATGGMQPWDEPPIDIDGLFACSIDYAGPMSRLTADAEVAENDAPRRSSIPPGIRAKLLPVGPR
jgi:eukaryotic-like serine/threonine-protein kinase